MNADRHTTEQAPEKPLSAPRSASTPEVGISGGSAPLNGPQNGAQRFWADGIEMVDDGPPHNGPLCFGPTGDWLCRQRADNGHSDHAPYVEGEYLRPAHPAQERHP